jgi:hypothetical protein
MWCEADTILRAHLATAPSSKHPSNALRAVNSVGTTRVAKGLRLEAEGGSHEKRDTGRTSSCARDIAAVTLASSLIAAATLDASAKHRRKKRKNSVALHVGNGPNRLTCVWFEAEPIHEYVCAGDSEGPYRLSERLVPDDRPEKAPPDPENVRGLVTPDVFSCAWTGAQTDPTQERDPKLYDCTYRHRHLQKDPGHSHRFRLSEAVLVALEDAADVWLLPHAKHRLSLGQANGVIHEAAYRVVG